MRTDMPAGLHPFCSKSSTVLKDRILARSRRKEQGATQKTVAAEPSITLDEFADEPSATSTQAKLDSAVLTYEDFITERQRIVDARQRTQQRVDQLITTGAAGALVLSITFMEKIAAHPLVSTRVFLLGGWLGLLAALAFNLFGHYAGQLAFDRYLKAYDAAYLKNEPCEHQSAASSLARSLDIASAIAFVMGVGLIAWFAYANLNFSAKEDENATGAVQQPTRSKSETSAKTGATTGTAPVSGPRSSVSEPRS